MLDGRRRYPPLQLARALLREGEHVSALENATAALACRPDYANAGMLQAECHMELLDFDAAAAAYRRVSALEPSNPAWTDCAARAAAMAAASPYEVLGVSESADAAEIKRAYKRECLQWHPDKHQGSAEDRARANTMFRRVTNAYEVLSDARRRGELDAKRRAEAFHQHYQSGGQGGRHGRGQAAAAAAPAQAAYDSFDAYSSFRTDQHPQSHHFYPPPSQAPSSYDYAAAHAARTAAREAAEAATYTSRRMDDRHSRRFRAPLSPRGVNLDEGGKSKSVTAVRRRGRRAAAVWTIRCTRRLGWRTRACRCLEAATTRPSTGDRAQLPRRRRGLRRSWMVLEIARRSQRVDLPPFSLPLSVVAFCSVVTFLTPRTGVRTGHRIMRMAYPYGHRFMLKQGSCASCYHVPRDGAFFEKGMTCVLIVFVL